MKSNYAKIEGLNLHYYSTGDTGPCLVLLHGAPVNGLIWEAVAQTLAPATRVIAPDLPGFGNSDKPLNLKYNLSMYTKYLQALIEVLGLEEVVLVGMDMGLLIALKYTLENDSKVVGLVMFEGFFMPIQMWYKDQSLKNRLILKMMGNKKVAHKIWVKNDRTVSKMISLLTVKKLSLEALNLFELPFKNPKVRERVLLDGVGAHKLMEKNSQLRMEVDIIVNKAKGLKIPKLLLYAEPGASVGKNALKWAQKSMVNLKMVKLGRGRHFLPIDQGKKIGELIDKFCQDHVFKRAH